MASIHKATFNKSEFYLGHIQSWQQSGMSQERYCQSVNIAYPAFVYWRTKFLDKNKKSPQKKDRNLFRSPLHLLLRLLNYQALRSLKVKNYGYPSERDTALLSVIYSSYFSGRLHQSDKGKLMILLDSEVEIYVYTSAVDMRKSIDGLVLLVVESMSLEPQSKTLFLFRNKSNDKVKGVMWHFDGFILLYKRKEKGRFKFPKEISETHYQIDNDLLQWLLKGFDFYSLKHHPELKALNIFEVICYDNRMENKDVLSEDSFQAVIDRLRKEIEEKNNLILEKDKFISEKAKLLSEAIQENERLRHQLNQLLQDRFGVKSEKEKNLSKNTFDEAIKPDNEPEIEAVEKEISVAAHQRKKGGNPGRKSLPAHLPRIQQIYDLQALEKVCDCGCELIRIGEDLSEQLDIIPAKVQVIQHIKYKYACKGCQETIKVAKGPQLPIPKSIASPGLLAHVAVSKFKDHLPLYRQENIFQRMGVDIARNTLSLWMIKAAQVLVPIYKLSQDKIVRYDIAYADETRAQVLKEPNRKPEDKSYMWCFIGGSAEERCVIYHYNISRAHTVIEEILEGFSGFLHCDGFSGYDAYAVDHDSKLVGCWMHCRRNFFEVARSTKAKGLADLAVKKIGILYGIEEDMRDKGFSFVQRYQHRQQYSKPLLEEFKAFLDEHIEKILPKSPLGQAFSYAIHQWPKLICYLEDGRLEIDNGLSERKIKPFVIGRKNWLFCNSIAGAHAAEILFSIIETCALHNVEPYAYLRFVLTRIPYAKTVEELERLMPFNIKAEDLNAP